MKRLIDNSENDLNPKVLFDAVKSGNLETVDQLLKNGANVNCVLLFPPGFTPLHLAAANRSTEVIKFLLDKGACVNAKEPCFGRTPLHVAVENGCKEVVALLLEKCADVNAKAKSNEAPLHIAARNGSIIIAEILLNHGANVHDFTLREGYTPLHFASDLGDLEGVKLYLNKGADINITSAKDNLTALHIATKKRHVTVVSLLLQQGALFDKQDKYGKTALNYAVEKGYYKIVEELLKHGANVNMLHSPKYNGNDLTPLHTAVKHKQGEVAKLLIRYNADINAKDKYGKTPMFYAIENEDVTMMQILLSSGANVKNDCQLLHFAAQNRLIEEVKILLENGVDINASDSYGRTALHFTFCKPNSTHFRGNSHDVDTDISTEIIKLLLTKGANVNAQTKNGVTTLHVAAEKGFIKIVEILLEKNANVNLGENNDITPLHFSAKYGQAQITKMLLNKGANVNAKTKDGTTTLHIAIEQLYADTIRSNDFEDYLPMESGLIPMYCFECDYLGIVETLLEFGADVNCRNKKSRTPLHIASHKGYEDIVKALLLYGADLNITCSNNYTPLYYAEQRLNKFYNGSFNSDNDPTVVQLKLHIIKMKSASLYLHEANLGSVQNFNEDYKNKCEEEIARMKSHKLENTKISFYDILVKDLSSLAKCMKNEDIVKAMEADKFKELFPIYADMINLKFRKAMIRKELLSRFNKVCRILFSELHHDCIGKIVCYLNDEDLGNVIKACQSG